MRNRIKKKLESLKLFDEFYQVQQLKNLQKVLIYLRASGLITLDEKFKYDRMIIDYANCLGVYL